ncbi:MAG: hypothetical protein WBW04_03245 [Nitrolancea sp.]
MGINGRMFKATCIAGDLTMGSIMPLAILHIAAPLSAPMVGGYWAGHDVKLSSGEAALLSLVTAFMVGAPLPLIQQGLGFFHYLSPMAIDIFAVSFAVYAGGLTGIIAWWGGSAARAEEIAF